MFDVFYTGPKPKNIPNAMPAKDLVSAATRSQTKFFWLVHGGNDYNGFDFNWLPDKWEETHIHVWPSQWQRDSGTYFANKHHIQSNEQNFDEKIPVTANSNIDIFFIDKFNKDSSKRLAQLKEKYDNVTKVRYVKSMYDTIKRCSAKTKASRFWVISSENDYEDFKFDWHAEPYQSYMFHIFGSQWQKWSDTFLVNKQTFDDHAVWCKDLLNMPDLDFVGDQYTRALNVYDTFMIDFTNSSMVKPNDTTKTTRFNDSYLAVLKRIVSSSNSTYIWVTSSLVDYSNFDFDWHPEPYQSKMLHVFSDGTNKFGDTFLIHVPTFKEQADIKLLDWYETVNYCDDQIAPRLPMDRVEYDSDDLTTVIKEHKFDMPYAMFYPKGTDPVINYSPSVWKTEDRALHVFTESGNVVLAPRDIVLVLDTQCYDYSKIMRHKDSYLPEKGLDIVYISNGEEQAEQWYEHLCDVAKGRTIHRINGINGRANAYKAAARASNTLWFFSVFAKLEVEPNFDWNWKPDCLQEPKHYVFEAYNPVNKLQYGHMAMIAYNKGLVLDTDDWGLDYTMSRAHEVLPILSGTARYNMSPIVTWRTAFRETIKLLDDVKRSGNIESKYRLSRWLTVAEGENAEWSTIGASDASEYFDSVNGNITDLLLSFEWQWLDALYASKYGQLPE